ncbi:hypothetical protein CTAYLR_008577 [Chrysophaeum taylorii]|uniref:Aspartate aminotransferase n=1 Tax=Chrysophaeum taylorii TaxID=2483200 RepID=A0AAD7XLA7_9STRA|nr:hypothetical protein CTAYLR_008577 [Chrysophaeum taylorii]
MMLRRARRIMMYSSWTGVELAPADPIIGLTQAFKDDPAATKVLLGVGAYRDGDGKPVVLPSVKKAEERVVASLQDHEYAAISGLADFCRLSVAFALGADSKPVVENRVACVQTLSGTGACRVGLAMLERLPAVGGGGKPIVYVPSPTWGNHPNIAKDAGLEVRRYRYLDDKTKTSLDFEGLMEDLEHTVEPGSAILLHACAHNPTGVDPSREQWARISRALAQKDVQVFFDCAYQGFASGDPENDAWAIRKFVEDGHNILLAQSYAKNFGLYGERVGALSAVCEDPQQAKALESQLKRIIRPMYSNPPVHGARVVATVLADPNLKARWADECKQMADRIQGMRLALKSSLEDLGSTKDWSHITAQIGMFAFTGLTQDQVLTLRQRFHIYCTLDGRISVAGLTSANVHYVAQAIHEITNSPAESS